MPILFLLSLLLIAPPAMAQTYEELASSLRESLHAAPAAGATAQQAQVQNAWKAGKILDGYLLERSATATQTVSQLAADLKEDPSRLYYDLQFARAFPEKVPAYDLPWGYFQYLLAVNDPRERKNLLERAGQEKWNWDQLRAEVKAENRDNREFVFTSQPGKTGVYRVMKPKRGPYQGQLVLDLGFGNYYRPSKKLKQKEGEIFNGTAADLFTYKADVIHVQDGDTFQAVADLGFGITTTQVFRLWGLDSPEINTPEGRAAQKVLEEFLQEKTVMIRARFMEKYGRYLADVWSYVGKNNEPVYVNQYLTEHGIAKPQSRQWH